MPPTHTIQAALSEGGLIDITTTGRRSGLPRRIEIVFHAIDGRVYISGMPGPRRAWIANLEADPRMVFHLKQGITADLPARGRVVTDPGERQHVLRHVTRAWGRTGQLEAFVEAAPLIEVSLDGPAARADEAAA
ncbi:hypothetical protein BH23CHL8_BH23CHL8_16180 [soil metagenome]